MGDEDKMEEEESRGPPPSTRTKHASATAGSMQGWGWGRGRGGGEDAADHVCAQHSDTGDASNEAQRQKHTHAEETAGTGAGEEGTNSPGGEEDVRTRE